MPAAMWRRLMWPWVVYSQLFAAGPSPLRHHLDRPDSRVPPQARFLIRDASPSQLGLHSLPAPCYPTIGARPEMGKNGSFHFLRHPSPQTIICFVPCDCLRLGPEDMNVAVWECTVLLT